MDATRYHNWIKELRGLNKANDKVAALKRMISEDASFIKFLNMVLNGTIHYNMSSIPKVKPSQLRPFAPDWGRAIEFLHKLSMQNGATAEQKNELAQMVADPDMHALASMIVQKDLKCGVKAATVNKVRPGSIFIMPYQRCSTSDHIGNIKWPAAIEIKADGMFINAIKLDSNVIYRTRWGNLFPLELSDIDERIIELSKNDFVLMGEFRVLNPTKNEFLPRKRGNGILNSIAQGNEKIINYYMKAIRYTVWDMIPYKDFLHGNCKISWKTRKKWLQSLPKYGHDTFLSQTDTLYVNSIEEAFKLAQKWISEKEEGAVIKNLDSTWKHTTSGCRDWVKIKEEKVCELRIVGWIPGKKGTKYEHLCGSVICESECGRLRVNVSGLTDEERAWNWDEYIDKIVSVKFNEVITSRSKEQASLNLPRVGREEMGELEIRHDKDTADTLDEIRKIKSIQES